MFLIDQSLVMFPLILGVFVGFHVLKKADLTTDGSYVLGACVYAKTAIVFQQPLLGIAFAALAGACAGAIVGLIQYNKRIHHLIAGILMVFVLYSINLLIMGRPNLSLLNAPILPCSKLTLLLIINTLCIAFLSTFLRLPQGMLLRAFGMNDEMVTGLEVSPNDLRIVGLSVSNGLIGFAGAMSAIYYGYADINMGVGQVLTGLAVILLSNTLINKCLGQNQIAHLTWFAMLFVTTFIYFALIHLLVSIGVDPIYFKLLLGVTLIVILFTNHSNKELVAC